RSVLPRRESTLPESAATRLARTRARLCERYAASVRRRNSSLSLIWSYPINERVLSFKFHDRKRGFRGKYKYRTTNTENLAPVSRIRSSRTAASQRSDARKEIG